MASQPSFANLSKDIAVVLQFFARVREIPTDVAEFTRRYGTFDQPEQIAEFLKLCAEINAVAAAFGNPTTLKAQLAKNPDVLNPDAQPADIYGKIVQLAGMTERGARTCADTLSQFESMPGDAATRAAALKEMIAGPGGLVGTAVGVRDATLQLRRELAPLLPRLSTAFTAFSGNSALNLANQALGALEQRLQRLRKQEEEARKKSESAIFGKSAAAQASAEAKAAREKAEADIAGKQAFAKAMEGFFPAGNAMVVASLGIDNAIQDIGAVFGNARDALMSVATAASPDQLGDPAWLARALDLKSEIGGWKALTEDASRFAQSALVDVPA